MRSTENAGSLHINHSRRAPRSQPLPSEKPRLSFAQDVRLRVCSAKLGRIGKGARTE